MSWLSDWIRKVTNNPKIPVEISSQKIMCRNLTVVGEGGYIEMAATKLGVRFTMATPTGVNSGSYANVWVLKENHIKIDFVHDKVTRAAIDVLNGAVVERGLVTPLNPTPPPDNPDNSGPTPPPALASIFNRPMVTANRITIPGTDTENDDGDKNYGLTTNEWNNPWPTVAVVAIGLLAIFMMAQVVFFLIGF